MQQKYYIIDLELRIISILHMLLLIFFSRLYYITPMRDINYLVLSNHFNKIETKKFFSSVRRILFEDILMDTYRTDEQFGTEKAYTSQYFYGLCYKSNMKYWFCKIYVAKVARAFCHVTSASLTSGISINDTLSRVHKTTDFRTPTLHGFWKTYPAICDGHTSLQNIDFEEPYFMRLCKTRLCRLKVACTLIKSFVLNLDVSKTSY